MAAETLLTANTGMVTILTENPNLNGSGNLGTVLTAAANGTIIKSVIIKAVGSTTSQGMVRLFLDGGGGAGLLAEIEIPVITQTSIDPCYEKHIELDLFLKSGAILKASTQIANTFNIIAEGLNCAYNPSQVRSDTTQYTSNTGMVNISTANSNLDGTGTLGTVLTAGTTASGYKGCRINSITIKAMQNTTKGMVRLFMRDTGGTIKLFSEIPVPYVTYSSKQKSFESTIFFDSLNIAPGYSVLASTQNSESFFITADAQDWNYAS